MKVRSIIPLVLVWLSVISVSSGQLLCKLAGWHNIESTAGSAHVSKMYGKLHESEILIQASPRYNGGPIGEKLAWAQQDFSKAFCEAGSIPGQVTGPKGAQQFIDTLGREKVINATDAVSGGYVSYPKMGKGLGLVTARIPDTKVENFLLTARGVFDNTGQTGAIFRNANYCEAHLLRDVDDLLGPGNISGSEKLLEGIAADTNGGLAYQLATTAKIKRRGEILTHLEPDLTIAALQGTGIDLISNQSYYNIGKSSERIAAKLGDPAKIKKGMEAAINDQKAFKMVFGEGDFSDANLQAALAAYNSSLSAAEIAQGLTLTASNFVKETLQ